MEQRVPLASLGENGIDVRCPRCRETIVEVMTRQTMTGQRRSLVLPPAWGPLDTEIEGLPVWALSNRGKRRQRHGKPLTNRRPVRSGPAGVVTTGHLPDHPVPGETRDHRSATPELPIIVVCPNQRCDRPCRLDADRLRINA